MRYLHQDSPVFNSDTAGATILYTIVHRILRYVEFSDFTLSQETLIGYFTGPKLDPFTLYKET